jgi:hypothetical protein
MDMPLGLEHGPDAEPGMFNIKTFNKISEKGLQRLPDAFYQVSGDFEDSSHAILLRRSDRTVFEFEYTSKLKRCMYMCVSSLRLTRSEQLTSLKGLTNFRGN